MQHCTTMKSVWYTLLSGRAHICQCQPSCENTQFLLANQKHLLMFH